MFLIIARRNPARMRLAMRRRRRPPKRHRLLALGQALLHASRPWRTQANERRTGSTVLVGKHRATFLTGGQCGHVRNEGRRAWSSNLVYHPERGDQTTVDGHHTTISTTLIVRVRRRRARTCPTSAESLVRGGTPRATGGVGPPTASARSMLTRHRFSVRGNSAWPAHHRTHSP